MNIHFNNRPILHDLGDGLILCRSTADDVDPLAEFNSHTHSDEGFDKPNPGNRGAAAFPHLSFLQLVFGYHTIEELEQSYADCWYKFDETRVLLNTLFPKKLSSVMMVN